MRSLNTINGTVQLRTITDAARSKRLRDAGVATSGGSSGGSFIPGSHLHSIDDVVQLKTELEKRLLKSDVLASTAETVVSEENVYSAQRSLAEDEKRLRKDVEDTAEKKITFADGAKFGDFINSLIAGKGAAIDKDGNGQVESLEVRSYLKVIELIYNRLNAIEGETTFTEFGTIDKVIQEQDGTYTLTIRKRWDMDFTAFQDHDVVYGVVNNLQTTGEFYTSWLRVHSKNTTANTLSVTMYADEECPAKRNFPPATGMNLTRRGNALNTPGKHNKRQDSWYISTVEGAMKFLQGVDSPIIHPDSIALVLGLLPELEKFKDLPINYDQPYIYAKGAVIQDLMLLDYKGKPVKTVRNRGAWVSNPDEPFRRTETMVDEVYHVGCKWQVVVDKTTDEPSYSSQGWLMAEGNTEFIVDIESSKGFVFDYETFGTTLTVIGRLYNQDVTSHILDADVSWTRDTGNIEEDNAWAIKVANAGKSIALTQADLGSGYNEVHNCRFTATVTLRDGNDPIQTNKVELIL